MTITATELKNNFGKYLKLLEKEDIFITKNGKLIGKLSNPNISAVRSLSGILEGSIEYSYDKEDLRNERLSKYEIID